MSESATPEELASLQESIREVRERIEDLPAEQQVVVRKRIYEDKTFKVISEEVGAPLGTVLTRMRAALAKLHRWLADKDRVDER